MRSSAKIIQFPNRRRVSAARPFTILYYNKINDQRPTKIGHASTVKGALRASLPTLALDYYDLVAIWDSHQERKVAILARDLKGLKLTIYKGYRDE